MIKGKVLARWYRLAADQGNAQAQYNLGVRYDNGEGVPQDYKAAARWYRLAADQGHAKAQTNLGVMYDNGEGVPQDYKKAHMWYNISAANGNESARKNRDLLAKEMTPEAVSQAQELASKWMESH